MSWNDLDMWGGCQVEQFLREGAVEDMAWAAVLKGRAYRANGVMRPRIRMGKAYRLKKRPCRHCNDTGVVTRSIKE